MLKRTFTTIVAAALLTGSLVTGASAKEIVSNKDYTIDSPYASVNWDTMGQYKADFHAHSNESDGQPQPYQTVEEHYKKGYDVLALTDHNVTNTTWNRKDDPTGKDRIYLTDERLAEITLGADRNGQGMIAVPNSNEQSYADHLNTFWANFLNKPGATLESNMAACEAAGGISHINHPGRYTGGKTTANGGVTGADLSSKPETVAKYVDLVMKYDSCVGMEIINKLDGDSYSDRILWDNILMETMPQGRNFWGFSNDDTHANANTGHSFNMMLMEENTPENVRKSMEDGAFYASAKVAKREGYTNTNIDEINEWQPPVITNIEVDDKEDTITIEGKKYNEVQWIADGKVIATGNTIDLDDYNNEVNSYVRAQLLGDEGISFTQAFGVDAVETSGSSIAGDKEIIAIENEDKSVTYEVSLKGLENANAIDVALSYDAEMFTAKVETTVEKVLFSQDKSTDGVARMVIGTSENLNGDVAVMKVTLTSKDVLGTSLVKLTTADIASTVNGITTEGSINTEKANANIEVYSIIKACDLNTDGKVTLADMSIALTQYQSTGSADVNRDGKVDTADLIIISGLMK